MNLCDINQIKLLLARHGFKFSKDLGQNFLCDDQIPAAIAEGAGITPDTYRSDRHAPRVEKESESLWLYYKVISLYWQRFFYRFLKELHK